MASNKQETAVVIYPPQMYHIWVYYEDATSQFYYTSSRTRTIPIPQANVHMHFTVMARSEHDAIARALLEGYATRDRY